LVGIADGGQAIAANELVEVGFEAGGDGQVVHRHAEDQEVGAEQFVDQLVGEAEGLVEIGAAIGGLGFVGLDPAIVDGRWGIVPQISGEEFGGGMGAEPLSDEVGGELTGGGVA
jgi:hypothetical protein